MYFTGGAFLFIAALFIYAGWNGKSIREVMTGTLHPEDHPYPPGTGPNTTKDDSSSARFGGGAGGSGHELLNNLAVAARSKFHLSVLEYGPRIGAVYPGWPGATVHRVHVPNSLHYKGRAFDCSGSAANMQAFALWVHHTHSIAQLFYDGSPKVCYNNASAIACPSGHRDHVHVGV